MAEFGTKYLMRTATVLLCGAALALPAMAQQDAPPPPPDGQTQGPPPGEHGGPGGRGNPERRVEMLQHRLNLTADQTAQVKTIMADGRAKADAMRNDTSGAQGDRRGKMMALMQEENGKIKAVLTDDQKKKFDEMEAQMRERRREHGPGGPGGGPGNDNAPPPPPSQQ